MEALMKTCWPFYLALVFTLLVVTYVPEVSLWLPRVLGG
jgi:TRAP-type C4-dicarboxylate transport system permease large subunit